MNKLENLKKKIKHRTPEIIIAASVAAVIVYAIHTRNNTRMLEDEFITLPMEPKAKKSWVDGNLINYRGETPSYIFTLTSKEN